MSDQYMFRLPMLVERTHGCAFLLCYSALLVFIVFITSMHPSLMSEHLKSATRHFVCLFVEASCKTALRGFSTNLRLTEIHLRMLLHKLLQ
jgi:hypothetical protein